MKKRQTRHIILETLETMLELQLKSIHELLDTEKTSQEPTRIIGLRRKSLIDLSIQILTEKRRPVHVDQMVELLSQRHGRKTDRDSLSSALLKKDKQGILVRRVAPATFALREKD